MKCFLHDLQVYTPKAIKSLPFLASLIHFTDCGTSLNQTCLQVCLHMYTSHAQLLHDLSHPLRTHLDHLQLQTCSYKRFSTECENSVEECMHVANFVVQSAHTNIWSAKKVTFYLPGHTYNYA